MNETHTGLVPETATIVVEVDTDKIAWWEPEVGFGGDHEVASDARRAAKHGYLVSWGRLPTPQYAGPGELGALHALMWSKPGRTRILRWPDYLLEWWMLNTGSCSVGEVATNV